MKRTYKKMSMGVLLCFLAVSPVMKSGAVEETKEPVTVNSTNPVPVFTSFKAVVKKSKAQKLAEEALDLYNVMDLKSYGLSMPAFEYALKGYKYLVEKGKIVKNEVLSICDFSQSSRQKRFYVIDMVEKKVLINTFVAHGRKSGGEFAKSFSNSPESHKSSLGFYVTSNTYFGSHGLSLKIEGLEKNINDKADKRNIVIHGSNYVGEDYLKYAAMNGRSYGCPALPAGETEEVIETIKEGTCLFIYHPTKSYITKSKVLNG